MTRPVRGFVFGAGVLRRRLGDAARHKSPFTPEGVAAIAVARAAKALGLQKARETTLPVTFRLDPDEPGRIVDLPQHPLIPAKAGTQTFPV